MRLTDEQLNEILAKPGYADCSSNPWCGNIVSFKNSKMIARGRLITDPEKQKRMESYTQAIVSQLSSEFQTIGAGSRRNARFHHG